MISRQAIWQWFLDVIDTNKYISKLLRLLRLRDGRERLKPNRRFYINNTKPAAVIDHEEPLTFCSNEITTSKYTWWNFVFKNTFEQLKRVANLFFVINAAIIFIIPDPPTSPYSYAVPVLLVLVVTGLKQVLNLILFPHESSSFYFHKGYEDLLRHFSDWKINNSSTNILRDGSFKQMKWKDIKVGDIVAVDVDQPFPCDLLLLSSMGENNQCYITTANLDGESNLKKKWAPPQLPLIENELGLTQLEGIIECDKANVHLHEFNGKVTCDEQEFFLTNDNILLRGCVLKVTSKIYGCAIYTGQDTKLMMNTKITSNKMSTIERRMNYYVICYLIILAILSLTSLFVSFAFNHLYTDAWYLVKPKYFDENRDFYNFVQLVTFLNFYHVIVPLSMYISIELQRFIGSRFMTWDINLYDERTNEPARVNSTDLNEDLGQVEYLLSDKTGTLTDNEMVFKQFSINGLVFEERDGVLHQINSAVHDSAKDLQIKLFQILTLCHSVQVDKSMKEVYQASSPDEFSFMKFCCNVNMIYEGEFKAADSSNMIRVVNEKGKQCEYMLLDILDFDSNRRRMSVIVRDLQTNTIMLLCKGAESSIFKCCPNQEDRVAKCNADINSFAVQGWRTLALAYKYLSEDEYREISNKLKEAFGDLVRKEEQLVKVLDEVESGLTLVGATAVEDKLQDGVPETIEFLRQGGIKVWVLTGDKKETAVNISSSCRHFSPEMIKLDLCELRDVNEIASRVRDFAQLMNKASKYGLLIDGQSLTYLFDDEKLMNEFREVCLKCEAVLCCRMSPSQKAKVVKLVKQSAGRPITAAIGDGANDVSMIQEAHVGLGIFGKEGRQAARSADFAYGRFRFTKRILFVHGYLYYTRLAFMVHYFFYKNFIFAVCRFYFIFFTAFSASSVFDSITLALFNVLFTSVPILVYGYFEQRVPIAELEKNPKYYMTISKNKCLNIPYFVMWNSSSVWHSLVCFFFTYAMFTRNGVFSEDGKVLGSTSFHGLLIINIVLVVHVKLLIEWRYKTLATLFAFLVSFFAFIIIIIGLNSFIIPQFLTIFTDGQNFYWSYFALLSKPSVWFEIALTVITCSFPDIVGKVIENMINIYQTKNNKMARQGTSLSSSTEPIASPTPVELNFSNIDSSRKRSSDRAVYNGNSVNFVP